MRCLYAQLESRTMPTRTTRTQILLARGCGVESAGRRSSRAFAMRAMYGEMASRRRYCHAVQGAADEQTALGSSVPLYASPWAPMTWRRRRRRRKRRRRVGLWWTVVELAVLGSKAGVLGEPKAPTMDGRLVVLRGNWHAST